MLRCVVLSGVLLSGVVLYCVVFCCAVLCLVVLCCVCVVSFWVTFLASFLVYVGHHFVSRLRASILVTFLRHPPSSRETSIDLRWFYPTYRGIQPATSTPVAKEGTN